MENLEEEVVKPTITIDQVQSDEVMIHPNGTPWIVSGDAELNYYNIYQFDDRKGIYPYNPFFLDDHQYVIIKKKNGEFKVGMSRENLHKALVHEGFEYLDKQ